MRVWLLKVNEALPSDPGEQRLLRMGLIAEELNKLGADITWWVSSFDHNKKVFKENTEKDYIVNDHYKLKYLHGNGYKKNWSLARLRHYKQEKKQFFKLAKDEPKPDIIYAAMPNMELAQAAAQYGKKNHIPVIIDIRDTWPELYADYAPKRIKKIVQFMIIPFKHQLSWTLSHSTGIFATSELFLDWALNYAKREKKENDDYFYVSYPDTNIKIKEEDLEEWYKSYKIKKDDFVVCFFGQFGHAVDLETVMKASNITAKKNPKIKYVICGTGEKLENYKNIINNDSVIFPGWVNRKQICALGKISKAGLLSYVPNKNYENSMPNKFCEYLALGLICIVQPKGMMNNLSTKYNCGYHYENEEELAELLLNLSNKSQEELNELKSNARELYEKQFRSDVVYKKLAQKILEISEKYKNE